MFMTERRSRKAVLLAVSTTCAALISGCGAIPGSAGGSPGPVVVMTWAPDGTKSTNMPGMPAMAQAFAAHVNASGGLNGRDLKVLTCNDHNDTVEAAKCAQRAQEEGAVAVIGSYSEHANSFTSILESAGIPYIGGYGITQEEFQSPMSYPVNGGLPALLTGSGKQLAASCSKVSLVRPDTIVGDQFPLFLDAGLKAGGRPAANDLPTADDSTEYTGVAQRAVGSAHSGTCVSAVLGDRTDTFIDSLRRLGNELPDVRLSSVIGSIQQSLIDSTGGRNSPLENAFATGWYPPTSDPKWDAMKEVVKKYAFGDNRIDVADPGVQTTWIAYSVFTEVVRAMGEEEVNPMTLKRALDKANAISTGGLTPDLGWRNENMLPVPGHPRMVNAKVVYQVVKDGRLVAARTGFVDMAATLGRQVSQND
ncbi:ABC transporter substrate-binding protein [Streptomyces sp. SID13666]|uniref:ABC transporter substrate-binding protein n=1 Tax=unclassified Streptomyces TaxID=2593676 RepID=UPI0013BF3CD7|nr:ABC transporter substrate-binding protein [Streptomyces sp. SID13666]NEA74391.1 ABC transporter substrate-binding protein [Streptomyces sp. SID13588]